MKKDTYTSDTVMERSFCPSFKRQSSYFTKLRHLLTLYSEEQSSDHISLDQQMTWPFNSLEISHSKASTIIIPCRSGN